MTTTGFLYHACSCQTAFSTWSVSTYIPLRPPGSNLLLVAPVGYPLSDPITLMQNNQHSVWVNQ